MACEETHVRGDLVAGADMEDVAEDELVGGELHGSSPAEDLTVLRDELGERGHLR